MEKLMSDEAEGRMNSAIEEARKYLESNARAQINQINAQLRNEIEELKLEISSIKSALNTAQSETSKLKDNVIERLSAVVAATSAVDKGAKI